MKAMTVKNVLSVLIFLSTLCMAMTVDLGAVSTQSASKDRKPGKFFDKTVVHEEVTRRKLASVTYNGGSVMSNGVNLYLIFYGVWSATRQESIKTFFSSLGSNSNANSYPSLGDWWNVLSTYKNNSGSPITSSVTVKGTYTYSTNDFGTLVTFENTTDFAVHAIAYSGWPITTNSIFLTFLGEDIQMEEGCNLCFGPGSLSLMVRSLPTSCSTNCYYEYSSTEDPTGDQFVGQAIYSMAVGLVSYVTNPGLTLSGYYSSSENRFVGALCQSNVAFQQVDSNNAKFNVYGNNGKKYIVPPIFNFDTQQCAIGLASSKKSNSNVGLIVGVVVAVVVLLLVAGIIIFIICRRRARKTKSSVPSDKIETKGDFEPDLEENLEEKNLSQPSYRHQNSGPPARYPHQNMPPPPPLPHEDVPLSPAYPQQNVGQVPFPYKGPTNPPRG